MPLAGQRQSAPRSQVVAALSAMRPAEWVKNGFVLAPLVFSGRFDEGDAAAPALFALAGFCAAASAGYLVNDLADRELDRRHPDKRTRAIASGDLAPGAALAVAAVLALGGLALAAVAGLAVVAVLAAYVALSLAYTLVLKHLVIVDVMTIVALFLARVLAGALAVDVEASEWLLLCTGMLSLFLGFAKRRQEAVRELEAGAITRPVLDHYSLAFLDQVIPIVTAGAVLSYAMYATESPIAGSEMLATVPPVVYGVFRYVYLVYHRRDPRAPAVLVTRDPGMLAAVAVWAATALVVLYA